VYEDENAVNRIGGEGGEETKRELAKEIMIQMLTDGAKLGKTVHDACKAAGVGDRTIDTAKSELKVKSTKTSAGWYWSL
jgi:hypothetical protein